MEHFCKAMCKHALNPDSYCTSGMACRFAHSIDELRLTKCLNGNKCLKVIKISTNYWINNPQSKSICPCIHPEETKLGVVYRRHEFRKNSCNKNTNGVYRVMPVVLTTL